MKPGATLLQASWMPPMSPLPPPCLAADRAASNSKTCCSYTPHPCCTARPSSSPNIGNPAPPRLTSKEVGAISEFPW